MAVRKLQVGGSKPSRGPHFYRRRPRFEACDGFRLLVSVPYGRWVLLHFLTPPESIDSAGRDEEHGIEHVGPEAEDRVEERKEDGRRGEARSHEHPAPSQPDEAVVEARFDEMMMERGVPDRQEHESLDGEEIEPVRHDGHLLERVMSQEGRREREQADEEEERIVEPDERPTRALHDLESDVMTDPEDADGDEAERVRQDSRHDVLEGWELLVCGACDVRDRQAEPEDGHHGSEDAVRQGLDPRLPQARDGASSRAHGPTAPTSGEVIRSAHGEESKRTGRPGERNV